MNIKQLIENKKFNNFIISIILINAVILGVQTSKSIDAYTMWLLDIMDIICLVIFIIEIVLKLKVYKKDFFSSGWNIFDFLIVSIALIPAQGGLSVLRAFRIFRVMRLITTIHSMRRVVNGMIEAIPGVGSVGGLLVIVFYIGAVMTTNFFGDHFPEWFGDIGKSMYTLFQVMTLESWSMGIVRPIMDVFPYSWMFFIPFIMVTTFTVLNLFIGIIVDAMASIKEAENAEKHRRKREQTVSDLEEIKNRLETIESSISSLHKMHTDSLK
ncbi:MAG: ion transporter [Magnetococcales bacterium]|nr:ion transporter [Magnetococcales bacterium]